MHIAGLTATIEACKMKEMNHH